MAENPKFALGSQKPSILKLIWKKSKKRFKNKNLRFSGIKNSTFKDKGYFLKDRFYKKDVIWKSAFLSVFIILILFIKNKPFLGAFGA